MNPARSERPAIRRGQHPTSEDLTRMRLGYPGYADRLANIKALNPARHAAILDAVKWFHDPGWQCPRCGETERSTRNLVCRACTRARVSLVFRDRGLGVGLEYIPEDEAASEAFQQRRQELMRVREFQGDAEKLGRLCRGEVFLHRGCLMRNGSVIVGVEKVLPAVDALLGDDADECKRVLQPLLQWGPDALLLLRDIAARVRAAQAAAAIKHQSRI